MRAQIEERRFLELPKGEKRPSYEDLISTLPDSLRIDCKEVKRLTEEEFLANFPNVTKEQLAAIPNAKTGPFVQPFANSSQSQPEDTNPFEGPQ